MQSDCVVNLLCSTLPRELTWLVTLFTGFFLGRVPFVSFPSVLLSSCLTWYLSHLSRHVVFCQTCNTLLFVLFHILNCEQHLEPIQTIFVLLLISVNLFANGLLTSCHLHTYLNPLCPVSSCLLAYSVYLYTSTNMYVYI